MDTASAGTPGSSTGKNPSVKDKNCPFCQQAFTSSSLGRHLDLYIKGKNPKPPDGVHNVDDIRRLRGTITRRQARTSHGGRENSTPTSSKATPIRDQRSPSVHQISANNIHSDGGPVTFFNRPTWEATGVMNDLPSVPRIDAATRVTRRLSSAGRGSVRGEIARKQDIMDLVDQGRAAELALKEILESVKAATMRAHPQSPFEFNFFSLSLPEMYLQCLAPPPTLLAEPPKPHQLSWSIDPPDAEQCEALRACIASKLQDWLRRQEHTHFGVSYLQNGMNGHSDPHPGIDSLKEEEASYYEHLSSTQSHWSQLPEAERQKQWHHALAKAFAREQEKHSTTTQKLDTAEQEILHLRTQLSQLTTRQRPPEFTQHPPPTLPLSREAISHLPNSQTWNYDTMTSKWRTRIISSRSTQHPLPTLPHDPSTSTPVPPQPNHPNGQTSHPQIPNPSDHSDNLPHNDPHPPLDEEDEHGDLADAPGDMDEDLDADGEMDQLDVLGRGVLDPHLRGGGDGDDNEAGYAGGEMGRR